MSARGGGQRVKCFVYDLYRAHFLSLQAVADTRERPIATGTSQHQPERTGRRGDGGHQGALQAVGVRSRAGRTSFKSADRREVSRVEITLNLHNL